MFQIGFWASYLHFVPSHGEESVRKAQDLEQKKWERNGAYMVDTHSEGSKERLM